MPFEDLTGTVVKKICMACNREFTGVQAHCPHDGNMLVPLPQDQWEGRRLADRYKIERRIGVGGMGVVYLAWHELMERWVAIKMLKQSFVDDQASVKRFQQEAKAASRLKHANVITLHDFGVTNTGQPYMVMDYLVGFDENRKEGQARSLAQWIKQEGQIPVEKCIHIIAQACEALDHAHRQGVIHRDIKPANIMIVPTQEDHLMVKVVDFGVAKLLPINNIGEEQQGLTQIGEVCGSPVYMSPEQCMGQPLDARADIYSMGVVLFEAITGKLPFLGRNMVETMAKHMNDKPPSFHDVRPDLFIPDKLEEIVMRALSKQPHLRQQSMSELRQDLQFSIPRPGQTPRAKAHELAPLPVEEKASGINWLWPAIGGGVVALAITGFVLFGMPKPPVKPTPPAATQTPPPAVTSKPAVPNVAPQKVPTVPTATTARTPDTVSTPHTTATENPVPTTRPAVGPTTKVVASSSTAKPNNAPKRRPREKMIRFGTIEQPESSVHARFESLLRDKQNRE